jgi:hypothetical protein
METRLRQASIGALALALLIFTGGIPSRAQRGGVVRTATVLPYLIAKPIEGVRPEASSGDLAIAATTSPTKNVFLNFILTGLPNGACVSGWTLRLYVHKPGQYFQNIRVFPVDQNLVELVHAPNYDPSKPYAPPPAPVQLLAVRPGMKSVSFAKVTPEDRVVDFDYSVDGAETQCSWLKANGRLGVTLQSDTNAEYAYYGGATSCEEDKSEKLSPCNTQPRLIVRYYTSPAANDTSWPQNKYDPQNSGQTVWKASGNPPKIDKPVELYKTSGYIGVPVIYEGGLILPAQLDNAGSKKYFITELDPRGQPVWNNPTPANSPVKFSLAVDAQGRVYAVTENCLLVLNAEDNGALLRASCWGGSCDTPCPGESLLNMKSQMSVRAAPTLGSNGAVYVPTNRGLFALTPYPELKVLWRFLDDKATVGQVALSADEATAYVEEGTAGKLIAIDTSDGSERWRGDAFTFESDEPFRQVPVVGPMNGEGENGQQEPVYVSGKGGLKVFLDRKLKNIAEENIAESAGECERRAGANRDQCWNQLDRTIEESLKECDQAGGKEEPGKCKKLNAQRLQECKVLQTRVREGITPFTDAVSRPVIAGAGEAYFVKRSQDGKGKLCRYAWGEKDPVMCASSPDGLSTLSMLASDGRGNVYIIDPTSTPQRVLGFAPPKPEAQGGPPPADGSTPPWNSFMEILVEATRLAGQEKSANFRGDNILIGPDGTVYSANDNVLFAMQPKAQDEDIILNSEKARDANRSAFMARQKITVESGFEILPAQSLILESAGSIGFQPGVSVPKGARLSCIIQPTLK